jgi:hypothetical protein
VKLLKRQSADYATGTSFSDSCSKCGTLSAVDWPVRAGDTKWSRGRAIVMMTPLGSRIIMGWEKLAGSLCVNGIAVMVD